MNKGGAETIVKLIYERLQQVIMNDDDTTLLYIIGRTIISTDQVHSVRRKINVFSQVEYTRNEREKQVHKDFFPFQKGVSVVFDHSRRIIDVYGYILMTVDEDCVLNQG